MRPFVILNLGEFLFLFAYVLPLSEIFDGIELDFPPIAALAMPAVVMFAIAGALAARGVARTSRTAAEKKTLFFQLLGFGGTWSAFVGVIAGYTTTTGLNEALDTSKARLVPAVLTRDYRRKGTRYGDYSLEPPEPAGEAYFMLDPPPRRVHLLVHDGWLGLRWCEKTAATVR